MATFRDISVLEDRARQLSEWLKKSAPECFTEQKHLDENTQERVYWHYGYMVALRDALRFLTGEDLPSQKSYKRDRTSSRSAA